VLSNSGHQFFINNPEGIANLIRDDLLGNVTHRFELCKYSIKYTDNQGNEIHLDQEEIEFREKCRKIEEEAGVAGLADSSPITVNPVEAFNDEEHALEAAVEDMMDGQ
jgi:hypothetical protein